MFHNGNFLGNFAQGWKPQITPSYLWPTEYFPAQQGILKYDPLNVTLVIFKNQMSF